MIELNPHAANGYHWLGLGLAASGQPDASITPYTQAWRLGRHEPWRYDTANDLAYVHYLVGNYESAITWGQRSLERHDDYLQAHVVLAAAYAQLGRSTEGRQHVDAILATRPNFSTGKFRSRLVYTRQEDRDQIVNGLLKAGLPQ